MRLRRSVVLRFAVVMSLAGLIWGVFAYFFYESPLALLPPFGYGLVSLLNVLIFAFTRRFRPFRFIQLTASLLLPFFMMVLLGGLIHGSATILWSLIAPLGALLVSNRRRAAGWFTAFLVLVLVSMLIEPLVSAGVTTTLWVRTIFFGMNIVGPLTAAFGLVNHFLGQKDEILAENVRLFREMQRQAQEMASLAEIGNDIVATLDLDALLGRITGHARELLSANNCAIYLVQPERETLRLIACAGEIPAEVKAFEPHLGQGIIGHVAQTGVAEIVSDTSSDSRRVTLPNVSASRRAEKLMVAPLTSRQEVMGVMSIWRPAGAVPFDAADLYVLESLSRLASIAITNARLYEETAAARAAAVAANEAKSAFLATMSHEIRTPMNAVIGMTSLLLDTPQTAEQREFTETIRSSGEILLLLINDILDFSKIEAGQLELEQRPFHLRDAVEAALELMAVPAADKGLDLAYAIAPETPETIVGDVTRLRQILINLLSNGIKFTEQGEVVVTVHAEPLPAAAEAPAVHTLTFAVRDTGIGIPAERMDRLFHSFSQVDASTTRTYGGTGLGLAICKRLSQLMGGDITVASQVGEGSTFTFTIQAEAAAGPVRTFLQDDQPHLAGRRLLIVDDNATNRRILQKQAEAWGMATCAVAGGREALDELGRDKPFDAAVLDMQMPEMDGLDLAVALRTVQQGKELPLLLLTSLGGLSGEQRTLADAHFAATLTKPVKPSQLYDLLLHIFLERPLPVQTEKKTAAPDSEFDPQMAQRLPLRILLVDDNSVNQKLGVRLLQRLGYRIDVAGNGLEALTAVQRQPYDVVFMDVQMPVMDGLEATRRIRQMGQPQPYVVATTADVLMDERNTCQAAGMNDFLVKPIRVQALIETLERAADSRADRPIPTEVPDASEKTALPEEETAVDAAALAKLQEMMGGEPAFLHELIDGFLAEAPQLLAQMEQGLAAADAPAIRLAAHSLKTNAADFGAARLHELTVQVEALAKKENLAELPELVAELHPAYAQVVAYLQQMRRAQDGT